MINIKRFLLGLLLLCPLIGHTAPASTVSRSVMEMSNIIVAPQFFWQTQIFSVPFSNVVNAVVTNHGGGSSTGGVAVIQGTNIVLTTNSGAVTINSTVGTNSLFWKTNFNNGITNTGGNVIVNSGTFQVGNGASGHVFFTNGSAALGNGNLVISPSAFTVKTNGSADVDAFLDDGEVFLGGGLLTYKVWLDFFGGLTVTNLSGSGNRFVQVDSTGKLSASVTTNLTLPNAVTNNDTRSITMSNNWSFQNITTTFGGNINAVGGLVTGGSLTAQNIHDNGLSDNTVPYASAGTHTLTSIANGGADTVLIGTAPPSFAPLSSIGVSTNFSISNTVYVSKNGNNATAVRGRIDFPFATLDAAQASTLSGDTVYVYPGCYTNADLGSNLVNWYFSPGTFLFYDSAGKSGGIFTDNPTTWVGPFSDGTNSRNFNIYGHVSATNLSDGFIKIGGAHSRINFEYDWLKGTSQNASVIVNLFNTYDFGTSQGVLDPIVNASGLRTEGTVYLSETAGKIDLGFFTNGLLYLDRDTVNPVSDLRISAREFRNCAIFGARPSGSKTIIDVPVIYGGDPFVAQGSYNISGIGYFHCGEVIFNNTLFIQSTNTESTNLFYCEWGNAYATPDYTNQAKLTFNNCRMLGRTNNTAELIRWSGATSTNPPTVCVIGDMEVCNFSIAGLPRRECAGSVVQNPMLANILGNLGPSIKGFYTNWLGTNFYQVINDGAGYMELFDAHPDSLIQPDEEMFKISSGQDGSGVAAIYGFLYEGDGFGLTNLNALNLSGVVLRARLGTNTPSDGWVLSATGDQTKWIPVTGITQYWLTNNSTGITNTGGNVIVNGGTLQIGTKSFLFNDGTVSLDNGIFSAGASSLSLGGTLTATNLGGTGTAFVQSSAAGVLSRTIDGSGLTNVTGTNIINTYKTFPSATNALALNNDYQLLSIGTDCSITNFTGGVANQVRWSTLIVSNSAASGITMRITAAGRAQGLQTTNGISIGAGKTAFISALILGTLNTNYCTTVQQ